jgi:hypothetical protein
MEPDGPTVKVRLEVDLRRESTPRTAERLIFLPPFAPAAETWACGSNCARRRRLNGGARDVGNGNGVVDASARWPFVLYDMLEVGS